MRDPASFRPAALLLAALSLCAAAPAGAIPELSSLVIGVGCGGTDNGTTSAAVGPCVVAGLTVEGIDAPACLAETT